MKRAVSAFSAAVVLTGMGMGTAIAQSAPRVEQLSPLQRQQLSRDLVPSSAQDFFRAGQANLEQEIRSLTRPRSSNETLLKVSQGSPVQPEQPGEKVRRLQHDRTR